MNNEIEFILCDAAYLWRRALSLQNKYLGLTNIERRIIIKVDSNPGATQIEIANLLEIEPQNLIRPLDKLVAEQLVEKRADEKDRRSNRLFITKQCAPLLKKINKLSDEFRPIALVGLTAAEIKKLSQDLTKVKKNLEMYLDKNLK